MPNRRIHKKKTIGLQRTRLAATVFLVGIAFGLFSSLAVLPNDSSFAATDRFMDGHDNLQNKSAFALGLIGESGSRVPWAIKESVLAPPIGWGVRKIGADSVWAAGVRGAGVVVAILDTGTRYTHVDLADHLWTNIDEIPNNGIDDDSNGYVDDYLGYDFVNDDGDPTDDNGHGTFMAGVVLGDGTAGFSTGVAPDAMLMSIKVLDSGGWGSQGGLLLAVQYALDNGADIICIAWGLGDGPHIERNFWRGVFTYLADAGLDVTVAAGPGWGDIPYRVAFPASIPPPWLHPDQILRGDPSGVIAVGRTDSLDVYDGPQVGPTEWRDFPYVPGDPDSTGLMKPDLSAPGYYVVSTDYTSDTSYAGELYGTTMACPHVTGAVALLRSAYPFSTPAEIDSFLEMTAVDLGDPGKDNFYGAGRVDVWAAYQYCVPGIEEETRRDTHGRLVKAARLVCSPNPSFGPIAISYAVDSPGPITIQMFDLAGRPRQEILAINPTSGQGTIHWNGRDRSGHKLPSGIYFVRLTTERTSTSAKVVLMN